MSRYDLYTREDIERMAERDDTYDALTSQARTETEYFGSVHSLLSALAERDVSKLNRNSRENGVLCPGHKDRVTYGEWYGFDDADDLRRRLETGSPEREAGRIDAHLKQVLCETEHVRGKVRYGPVGGSVCVPRALIGIPAMRHRERDANARNKVVNIVVDTVVSYKASGSDISEAGARVMEAVALLQREGYRVGLTVMTSVRDLMGERFRAMAVNIKRPGEGLDLAIVNWWLTSPAVLRGVVFSWLVSAPDSRRAPCNESLGCVPNAAEKLALASLMSPGCAHISLSTLVDMREKSEQVRREWVIKRVTEA